MDSQYTSTGSATLIGNMFTRDTYTFMGWNTKADGSGTSYEDGADITITEDVTLYAQWKPEATIEPDSEAEVDGLDEVAEDLGYSVTMSVKTETISDVPEAEAGALEEAAAAVSSETTLEFLNIKIEKTEDGTPVTETGKILEIVVDYQFSGKENVKVYRYHDGVAEAFTELSAKPATREDATFFADRDNGKIYIYTCKFSTYAIGYVQCYNISGNTEYDGDGEQTSVGLLDKDGNDTGITASYWVNGGECSYSFTHVPQGTYFLKISWFDDDREFMKIMKLEVKSVD